jgi:hypothetical protein
VGDSWLSVTKIIGLAMVPVYVAAALSFGLLFTAMVSSATFQSGTTQKSDYIEIKDNTITMFGTEFTVVGTPVGPTPVADLKKLGGGFIGQLVMQMAALGILWFAVMAALKSSEVTAEAAKPVSEFGGQIGGLIKSLPKYAPIIPT